MKTIVTVEREIAEAREKLEKLEEQHKKLQEEHAALSPQQRLAVGLHDSTCTHDHTDRCGWFYEFRDGKHDWRRGEHEHYLVRAYKLISHCGSYDKAKECLDHYNLIKRF